MAHTCGDALQPRASVSLSLGLRTNECESTALSRLSKPPTLRVIGGFDTMNQTTESLLPHHRLRAYRVALELLRAVKAANIRDRTDRDPRKGVPFSFKRFVLRRVRVGTSPKLPNACPARIKPAYSASAVVKPLKL